MNRILINCRYTSHHFAIRKVIHGIVESLDINMPKQFIIYLLVNKNNVQDFSNYTNYQLIKLPFSSDNSLLNHAFVMFFLPLLTILKRIDTVVFPQISFFLYSPARVVTFIHDLIEYKLNNQKPHKMLVRRLLYPHIARSSDAIFTVSNNSKNDIVKEMRVRPEMVFVGYDGVDHILKFINSTREEATKYVSTRFNIEKYILYVGYLSLPQKNLLKLIESYFTITNDSKYNDVQLVFVGPLGKDSSQIFDLVQKKSLKKKFVYLGTVSEEELAQLYKTALFLCFPSLYEGFGMPVAEAMACGCPVISSNRSSLPEVLGKCGLLFNPESIDEISSSMRTMLDSSQIRDEFSRLGIDRSETFRWSNIANTLTDVLIGLKR